jgi:hypothetical protein
MESTDHQVRERASRLPAGKFKERWPLDAVLESLEGGSRQLKAPRTLVGGRQGGVAARMTEAVPTDDALRPHLERHRGKTRHRDRRNSRPLKFLGDLSAATSTRPSRRHEEDGVDLLLPEIGGDLATVLHHPAERSVVAARHVICVQHGSDLPPLSSSRTASSGSSRLGSSSPKDAS